MAKRTRAQRKKVSIERNGGSYIAGIRRRGPSGKQHGGGDRHQAKGGVLRSTLAYRESLFPDGQKGLAARTEAGYPLGVYYLRGDLSPDQHAQGLRFAALSRQVARLLGTPGPFPRATQLDGLPRLRRQDSAEAGEEFSQAQLTYLGNFLQWICAYKEDSPAAHYALETCCRFDHMGKPAERPGGDITGRALPEYTLDALLEGLEEFQKQRF